MGLTELLALPALLGLLGWEDSYKWREMSSQVAMRAE